MSDAAIDDRTKKIAFLNDTLRATCFGGTFVVTQGVQGLGPLVLMKAVDRVRTFDDFAEANDPYGERDFGSFELAGEVLFWKIDLYEEPDVKDANGEPAVTRVLTVMLAEEY